MLRWSGVKRWAGVYLHFLFLLALLGLLLPYLIDLLARLLFPRGWPPVQEVWSAWVEALQRYYRGQ